MKQEIKLTALGSGSSGNSFVIQCGNRALVLDAGFSARELERRMEQANIDVHEVIAVLLTHEHSDHWKGCRVFCDKWQLPLYLSGRTADYLRRHGKQLPLRIKEFSPGVVFKLGAFSVLPFSVRHDAEDTVGFHVECARFRIGFATDIGYLTNLAEQRLQDCDALVLECNYDRQMLLNSQRALKLKYRIMSQCGHMDNQEAIKALDRLLTPRSKALFLAHISGECNEYNLVRKLAGEKLTAMNRNDIELVIPEQHSITRTVSLKSYQEEEKIVPAAPVPSLPHHSGSCRMEQGDLFDF